jgi:hypothetical protein
VTVASEIAACPECRRIVEAWWQHGIADDRSGLRADELALYEHLVKRHPTVALTGRDGCRDCQGAVAMAQFALPGLDIRLKDDSWVDPARLHFVHHLLEQTADLDRASMLTSSHTITAYLYHHASGDAPPGHVCSPDRGHAYDITVELTAPVRLVTDEQAAVLKTVVGEMERDLQFRELERIGSGDLRTVAGLAGWVHHSVAARLAGGLGERLSVRVEVAGGGPAVFPPPQ